MTAIVLPVGVLLTFLSYAGFISLPDLVWLSFCVAARNRQYINTPSWPLLAWSLTTCIGVVLLVSCYRILLNLWSSEYPQKHGPRVLFLPSRTSHTRFFPQRHSFGYSYLLAGVPVGWKGSVGGMLSVDQSQSKHARDNAWFSVDAEDYLYRGSGHLGLRGKLSQYLQDQGCNPEDYPHAYLFTAPKFLGYFNNPVSFWYLYNADRALTAMVLEVNNTFDERRMYLLVPAAPSTHAQPEPNDELRNVRPESTTKFSQTWPKDFHVSPFSSRKGFYTLNTSDPLMPPSLEISKFSATVTLLSSKSETKLVARVFSEGNPIDPSRMSVIEKVRFIITWWWAGYLTFPRVAYEAAKLWFKRGLYVWARPEPYTTTVSRVATQSEEILAGHFRTYLQHIVESCPSPLSVTYYPAGVKDTTPTTFVSLSDSTFCTHDSTPSTDFKVLTPSFYSRFIHYAHDLEGLFNESTQSNTIILSNLSLLPLLVLKKPVSTPEDISSLLDHLILKSLRFLRKPPSRLDAVSIIGKPASSTEGEQMRDNTNPTTKRSRDLRTFRNSSMDGFFFGHKADQNSWEDRRAYGREVLRVLIADVVALGDVGLLWTECLIIRVLGIWWASGFLKV